MTRSSDACAQTGVPVETGRFRAHMVIDVVNDGPVTILVDSRRDVLKRNVATASEQRERSEA